MTIYLVEDDATIAGAVASHLRAWGYDCVVAADFRDVAGNSAAPAPAGAAGSAAALL